MNLDSLVAIAGLMLAVYAILPEHRRLELKLHIGKTDVLLVGLGFMLVVYLQFYKTFRALGFTVDVDLSKWSIDAQKASFLILLGIASAIISKQLLVRRLVGFPLSRTVSMRDLIQNLLFEGKYSEVFSLLDKYADRLYAISKGKLRILKVRKFIAPQDWGALDWLLYLRASNGERPKRNFIQRNVVDTIVVEKSRRWLASLLPKKTREREAAGDILRQILLSKESTKWLAKARPYLVIKMLACRRYETNEFFDNFIRALFENRSSILYSEIVDSQNTNTTDAYDIWESSVFLTFLLKDVKVAENFGVYKPVGDYVLSRLRELGESTEGDYLNRPTGGFNDKEIWQEPIYIAVRFFDLMVSKALAQGMRYHMWLLYLIYFVQRMVENYRPSELLDTSLEFPTKYHYLLYETIDTFRIWISLIQNLDDDNPILEIKTVDLELENITKCILLAYGQCLYEVVSSEKFTPRFKEELLVSAFRCYFELKENTRFQMHAETLLLAIKRGGTRYHYGKDIEKYLPQVAHAFRNIDQIQYNVSMEELKKVEEYFTSME